MGRRAARLRHASEGAGSRCSDWVGAGTPRRRRQPRRGPFAASAQSRLTESSFFSFDPEDRLRHARGQSLPDWVALRSGQVGAFPDAVAHPETPPMCVALLAWARRAGTRAHPLRRRHQRGRPRQPRSAGPPVVTVDLGRMSQLLDLDEDSRLATFGAGVAGPDLEAQLRAHAADAGPLPAVLRALHPRRLGRHALQRAAVARTTGASSGCSPAGGWRRPQGTARAPRLPRLGRRAGPERAGARLRGSPRRHHRGHGARDAAARARGVRRRLLPRLGRGPGRGAHHRPGRLPLSMLRLSAPRGGRAPCCSGRPRAAARRPRGVADASAARARARRCCSSARPGPRPPCAWRWTKRWRLTQKHAGRVGRPTFGAQWTKNRFRAPYLRNSLWDAGYAVTRWRPRALWPRCPAARLRWRQPCARGLAPWNERVHVFTHLSHVYPTARASTPPTSSASAPRPRDAGPLAAAQGARRARPSSPGAAPSATSTAWASTTRRTSRPRRGCLGLQALATCSGASTRQG